jgi:hypothetical protein
VRARHAWYVRAAVSGWRLRSSGTIAAVAALLAVSGCGGGPRQDEGEPTGNFPVSVTTARFPAAQRMSEHTHMVIAVRNVGDKVIPNPAVTICNISCQPSRQRGSGTASAVFSDNVSPPTVSGPAENVHQSGLASSSRPVWILEQGPGKCIGIDGVSCAGGGGAGADVTAYANTWAQGRPLKPGETATFDWSVIAVKPGSHVVAFQVGAGLNGLAHAVVQGGATPSSCASRPGSSPACAGGTFNVTISRTPPKSYVSDGGQIINTP